MHLPLLVTCPLPPPLLHTDTKKKHTPCASPTVGYFPPLPPPRHKKRSTTPHASPTVGYLPPLSHTHRKRSTTPHASPTVGYLHPPPHPDIKKNTTLMHLPLLVTCTPPPPPITQTQKKKHNPHASPTVGNLPPPPLSPSHGHTQKSTTPHIGKQSIGRVFFAGQQVFCLLGELEGGVGLGDSTVTALPTAAPTPTTATQRITGGARGTAHLSSQICWRNEQKNTTSKWETKETKQKSDYRYVVMYCKMKWVNVSQAKRKLKIK